MKIIVCSLLYFLIRSQHVFASWDTYIDMLIDHSGIAQPSTDKACIIGLDGSKWTTDLPLKALKLTETEAAVIASAMESRDYSTFRENGIIAEGVSYRFFRADEDGIVPGTKRGHGAIILKSSNTAVVIGHTREGGSQYSTEKAVSICVEFLKRTDM